MPSWVNGCWGSLGVKNTKSAKTAAGLKLAEGGLEQRERDLDGSGSLPETLQQPLFPC